MSFKWPLFTKADQFFDDNGKPLPGGKLVFSASGTSTALAVYGDPRGGVSLGNTVVLDMEGRPRTPIYLNAETEYRLRLLNADGSEFSTPISVDNVIGSALGIANSPTGITLAKFADITANRLIGFPSGSAEEIVPVAPLALSGTSISTSTLSSSMVFLKKQSFSGATSHDLDISSGISNYAAVIIYLVNVAGASDTPITMSASTNGSSYSTFYTPTGIGLRIKNIVADGNDTGVLSSDARSSGSANLVPSTSVNGSLQIESTYASQHHIFKLLVDKGSSNAISVTGRYVCSSPIRPILWRTGNNGGTGSWSYFRFAGSANLSFTAYVYGIKT